MFKRIKFQINNIRSENDKLLIETEIDVLGGVKNVAVDEKNGETLIEFDDSKISQNKLLEAIQGLGFQVSQEMKEGLSATKNIHTLLRACVALPAKF